MSERISQTPDPSNEFDDHEKLSRRQMFSRILGVALAGMTLTETAQAEEQPDAKRTQQLLEAIREFARGSNDPIAYHQYEEKNLHDALPILTALSKLTNHAIELQGMKRANTSSDQVLTAKQFAQSEFLNSMQQLYDLPAVSDNTDLDVVRMMYKEVLPRLAAKGIFASLDIDVVHSKIASGNDIALGINPVVVGAWKIPTVTHETIVHFWDNTPFDYQEIHIGDSLSKSTQQSLFPFSDLREATKADAQAVHDAVIWMKPNPASISQELTIWHKLAADGSWQRAQSNDIQFYERSSRNGRLPDSTILKIATVQCYSVFVPDLLAGADPEQAYIRLEAERLRVHEASHVYWGRQPAHRARYPLLQVDTLDIEVGKRLRLQSQQESELGALLGEMMYGPSTAMGLKYLCLYAQQSQEQPRYAEGAQWILTNIIQAVIDKPARFGVVIDPKLSLSPTNQVLLQLRIIAQPAYTDALREVCLELATLYRKSNPLRSHTPSLIGNMATNEATKKDLPLGLIGTSLTALVLAAGAAALWRQKRMQEIARKKQQSKPQKHKSEPTTKGKQRKT